MNKLLYWFILGIVGSGAVATNDCTGEKDSAVATKGHPFFLNFDYDGPSKAISYSFSKDGVTIDGDNVRVFLDMDRIFFLAIKDSDAGIYNLSVEFGRRNYRRSVRVCGKGCIYIVHSIILCVFHAYIAKHAVKHVKVYNLNM